MNFACFSKDDGNCGNGAIPIAQALRKLGHEISFHLDHAGSAAASLTTQGWLSKKLWGYFCSVIASSWPVENIALIFTHFIPQKPDAILVTLSASGEPNIELMAVQVAHELKIPVFGIEEVPGGRHNPGWEHVAPSLTRLITVMKQQDDSDYPVMTFAPFHLMERYGNVDFVSEANRAREKLSISEDVVVLWMILHPNQESPAALLDFAHVACLYSDPKNRPGIAIVTRHRRELLSPIPCNAEGYRYAMTYLATRGVRVIDNSPEFAQQDVPLGYGILYDMQPASFATYTELLALCREQGIIMTGFASAGLIDAPYLNVPSILYTDLFTFGGLGLREKSRAYLPDDAMLRNASSRVELQNKLEFFLPNRASRSVHLQDLKQYYPWPLEDPADLAARAIIKLTEKHL